MNGSTRPPMPHFVLVPMLAQGHMIPMIDMAHLLTNHGAIVSFITTPFNASRIKTIIDRMKESHLPIEFVSLTFPCRAVGLPEGCENVDVLPSRDLGASFLKACALLKEPLIRHLREQTRPPICIISDSIHSWTGVVARELGIPRLVFHGMSCFSILCMHIVYHSKIHDSKSDGEELFAMPEFPHRLEMTRAQLPGYCDDPGRRKFREESMEEESRSDGVVANSFDDLDALYVEHYQRATGKRVWTIGPMSLCNNNFADMAARGRKASIDEKQCLQWLDSMKPGSVIYVSFGSLARTEPPQLLEIGLGLEASNHPFIWVIKAGDKSSEVEEWLSEGFEERTRSRGLIIRGWAPQVMILSHPAVGGFMTHCGWNSSLEGICAGVPMITWPHFAEQFLNEKLIVDTLKIGVSIGVKKQIQWGTYNNEVLVKRDDIGKAVARLMDEGADEDERRKRARDLAEKAKKAVEGGSSHQNLMLLIREIQSNKRAEGKAQA